LVAVVLVTLLAEAVGRVLTLYSVASLQLVVVSVQIKATRVVLVVLVAVVVLPLVLGNNMLVVQELPLLFRATTVATVKQTSLTTFGLLAVAVQAQAHKARTQQVIAVVKVETDYQTALLVVP
jgi:hypothetical protein